MKTKLLLSPGSLALWTGLGLSCLNAQAQTVTGPGSALSFIAASNQYVQVSTTSISLTPLPFTCEAWVYPMAQAAAGGTIISRGDGGNGALTDYIVQLDNNGSTLKIGFFTTNGWDYSTGSVPTNAWTHVAVTYDGTYKQFFTNGVLDSTVSHPGGLHFSGTPVYIGRQGSNCDCNLFGGSMDEVRLWNVVRTQAQIQQYMNQALLGTEPGLLAYYRMDENGGKVLTNSASSGTNNNGTLPAGANSPAWVLSGVPFIPYVSTLSATSVAGSSATLNATVNPGNLATTAWFQWGVTTNYGSNTPVTILSAANSVQSLNSGLSGLSPVTTYHFRIAATNSVTKNNVGTNFGLDQTFTTTALLPTVTTLPVTTVSNLPTALNGMVNPGGANTTVWFEWGPYPANNTNRTAPIAVGSGLTVLAVSNNLSGFTPGVFYRCRMVASNAVGVVRGNVVNFGSPALLINGSLVSNGGMVLTNECHSAFTVPAANGPPLAIAAGSDQSLALRSDGLVVAWGGDDAGESDVPAGLSNVVAIVAKASSSLALKSDGTVAEWGYGAFGETNVPAGLSNVVAIAAGELYSLALKSDGTIVGWGYGNDGGTSAPAGLSNVVALAAGQNYSLALKSDGTITGWGDNGDYVVPPAGLSNLVAIDAEYYHALALKSDGTVVSWGDNTYGETSVPAGLSNVVAIAAGSQYSLALKSDGTVIAWGAGKTYNPSDNIDYGQAIVPAGLSNVVAIAAGDFHALALKSDGTVIAWGAGTTNSPDDGIDYGQAIVPASLYSSLNVAINGNVNTNVPGSYPLTYAYGNLLGLASATVTVDVVDTKPPVLTLLGNIPLLITNVSDLPFVDPGATAFDLCAGACSVTAVTNPPLNVNLPGVYTVTYRSMDSSGNTVSATRQVIVAMLPSVAGDLNGDGIVSAAELNTVYSNYLATSPYLLITNTAGLGGANVTFELSNSLAAVYSVQYSTDLVNWLYLGPAAPFYFFTDTNAPGHPKRYYRLSYP